MEGSFLWSPEDSASATVGRCSPSSTPLTRSAQRSAGVALRSRSRRTAAQEPAAQAPASLLSTAAPRPAQHGHPRVSANTETLRGGRHIGQVMNACGAPLGGERARNAMRSSLSPGTCQKVNRRHQSRTTSKYDVYVLSWKVIVYAFILSSQLGFYTLSTDMVGKIEREGRCHGQAQQLYFGATYRWDLAADSDSLSRPTSPVAHRIDAGIGPGKWGPVRRCRQ